MIQEAVSAVSQESGPGDILPDSPPPGTGNLTLADLCTQYNLNLKKILRELKSRGIAAAESLTLKQIAQESRTSQTDVYAAIRDIVVN